MIRVYDPRPFHAGRRAFCRRLLEAAAQQPGIDRAEIDSQSATCELVFEPSSANARMMANAFSDAVRQAADDPKSFEHRRWWSRRRHWSALTAYRLDGDVCLWETLETKPGRVRLRPEEPAVDRTRLARLADSVAGLDGVEVGRLFPWSRALTVEFPPESLAASSILDRLEKALEISQTGGRTVLVASASPDTRTTRTVWARSNMAPSGSCT